MWSSLACQIQFCMISSLGQLRECVPSPPFSSTSLVLLPATFSQLLLMILGQEFPVCQEGTRPGNVRSRLQGAASGQRLPRTSLPPLSSGVLFFLLRHLQSGLWRWQERPTEHVCPLKLHQSFQKQFLSSHPTRPAFSPQGQLRQVGSGCMFGQPLVLC